MSGVDEDPPVQIHPLVIEEQSASHPSPEAVLLSSHASPSTLNPSPQIGSHSDLESLGSKPVLHKFHSSTVVGVPPDQA